MARLANISPSPGDSDGELKKRSKPMRGSPTPPPSASSSSRNRDSTGSSRQFSGNSRDMPPPNSLPTPDADPPSPRASKRRRIEEEAPKASQVAHERELSRSGNTQFYDPDQDPEERRKVRKDLRDLSRQLTDSRAEYLAPGSDGLIKTLNRANEIFVNVKQTSDATLDSRLLVSAADLSAKRTTNLNLGDASHGIDVDDFVSRCIGFMRRAPDSEGNPSGSRRRGRGHVSDDDGSDVENGGDEGDAFNWEWLGQQACFPNSLRPPVPGFLLGPLSVQKRIRKQTQRRERLQKRDPKDAVRPEEVKTQDMEKVENANLTTLCRNIRELLVTRMKGAGKRAKAQVTEDMAPEEQQELFSGLGIADDFGIPLFQFVVNPKSFGQTVENLFYVSFLIKEGTVGIGKDSSMLPTLHATSPANLKKIKEEGLQKHQAVFHLDFETWEDLIDAYDITESIIPHRDEDGGAQVNATGWYT